MATARALAALLAALFLAAPARAQTPAKLVAPARAEGPAKPAGALRPRPPSQAPLKAGMVSRHSPYEIGDCSLCHVRKSAKDPGPVKVAGNKGCFLCHEEIEELLTARRFKHAPAEVACTNCHNAHNSAQRKLLLEPSPALCLDCHVSIGKLMAQKVTHAAVTEGAGCMNCHSPHASNVEHLLLRLPFDLCLNCHNKDGMTDPAGVQLTNMKKLLEQSTHHHGPVAQKDCSACHEPHGAQVFRLLIQAYPSTFYAPFDVKTYAMCFGCHDEQLVTVEKTATATRFREGDLNLHFLHVNKSDRGRTCRACHEVHASQRTYQIRETVPFGANGYKLQVNFEKRADGGTCTQTCHTARSYNNAAAPAAAPVQAKAKAK